MNQSSSPGNVIAKINPNFGRLFSQVYLGIPISVLTAGTLGLESRILTIPYLAILSSLSFVTILKYFLNRRFTNINGWFLMCFLFWIMYTIRILYDIDNKYTILQSSPIDYLLKMVGIIIIPSTAMALLLTFKQYSHQKKYVFISCLLIIIINIIQFKVLKSQNNMRTDILSDNLSDSLSPIVVGYLSSSAFSMAVYYFISDRLYERNAPSQLLYIIAILICGISLNFTGSRGSFVASLICIGIIFISQFSFKQILPLILGIIFLSLLFLFRDQLISDANNTLELRVTTTYNEIFTGGSKVSRLILWQQGFDQFIEKPLLGSGFIDIYTGTYPHNLILEAFMATGIVGGFIFLILIIKGVHVSYHVIKMNSGGIEIAIIFLNYTVASLFSFAIYDLYPFWFSLVYLLCSGSKIHSHSK